MFKFSISIIFLATIFANCSTAKARQTIGKSDTLNITMEVVKIVSTDSFYLIYTKSNDSLFRIISKKTEDVIGRSNVETNRVYLFKLTPFLDQGAYANPLTGFNSSDPCFMLSDQTQICREKDVYGPYKSLNLKGLYYLGK